MSVSKDFFPKVSHPLYFIRKGIYNGVKENADQLKGVLLDFGCGQKPYKSLFNVEKYIGIDYENPGHDHKNEQIDVFYDGKNIPFDNEYFDSALCSEVFEHLFELETTMQELHRVLKKGGKLLVTCPFVWDEHEVPHDFARYTFFSLDYLFKKHGFKIVSFKKHGNFLEAVTQIKMLYFLHTFAGWILKIPGGKYINTALITVLNSWGIFKSFILPKKYNIYLSNVFLVEKT